MRVTCCRPFTGTHIYALWLRGHVSTISRKLFGARCLPTGEYVQIFAKAPYGLQCPEGANSLDLDATTTYPHSKCSVQIIRQDENPPTYHIFVDKDCPSMPASVFLHPFDPECASAAYNLRDCLLMRPAVNPIQKIKIRRLTRWHN